jgi:mono/diheme cytochrome c family protein
MLMRSAALLLALLASPLAAEVRDLKAFYLERCVVCHGQDGTGRAGGLHLGGRNLTEPRWLAKQEESALATTILAGRGAMPGFRRQLSEVEARRLAKDVIQSTIGKKHF